MLRKIFTFGITLLFIFSFMSCGGKNEIEEIDPEGISSCEDIPSKTEPEDADLKIENKETSEQSSESSNTNEESSLESNNTQSISATTIHVTPMSTSSGSLPPFKIENENSKKQILIYLSNLGSSVPHEPYIGATIFVFEITNADVTTKYQLTSETSNDGKNLLLFEDNWYLVTSDFWSLMKVIYPNFDISDSNDMPLYSVSIMNSTKMKSFAYAYFGSGQYANSEDTKISGNIKGMLDSLSPVEKVPEVEGLKYYYVVVYTDKDSSTQEYCCYQNGYVELTSRGEWYTDGIEIYNYISALID